jgi:cytochrome c peroxidase
MLLLTSCSDKQEDKKDNLAKVKALSMNRSLPKEVISPEDNPTTPQKVKLGKLLFYDPILSGNKDVACATCHHPDHGYAEFLDISIGVNGKGLGGKRVFKQPNDIPFVKRNSQTVLNTAFNGINIYNRYTPESAPMFWDLRVTSLENQALEPIKSLEEMKGHKYVENEILEEVISRLKEIPEYQQLFRNAFKDNDPINTVNLGKAIAAFERTLITTNSRFDQFMNGDQEAISISEKEGFEIFKKSGCANCHNGAMFSDFKPHVLGAPENEKLQQPDSGIDRSFAFRTASLRNLRFTAPYMHNGSLKTLKEVLEFYEDISFGKSRNQLVPEDQLDPLVDELDLSVKDMGPIISFLNTLNDESFDKEVPESVPSGLPVGGNIQ